MTTLWPFLVCIVVNGALLVWSVAASWRLHQRLQHAKALDDLLGIICIQAFSRQNQPIWQAWAETMGNIEVSVKQMRNFP